MTISKQDTVVTYTVQYRSGISSGVWSSDNYPSGEPRIDVDQLTLALPPRMSVATLSRERGLLNVAGRQYVQALDLRGKQVKIVLTDTAQGSVTWYGYVADIADQVDATASIPVALPTDPPTTVHSGRATYTAYGLEYHLSEVTLQHSVTDVGNVGEIIPFNLSAVGGGIEGNRTGSEDGGSFRFASTATYQWTARDVAEYLLRIFNDATGENWSLGGYANYLDRIVDVWRFSVGQSIFAALNDVIGTRYGFAWKLVKTSDNSDPVITVVSTLASSYSAGDILIPPNQDVVTLSLHEDPSIGKPSYDHVENAHYDNIVARGGPIRCGFTMHKGDSEEAPLDIDYGTIEEGWDGADLTAYNAAASDEARQESRYRSLWRDFVLPASWDGEMSTPTATFNCIPTMKQSDESYPLDLTAQQTKYYRDWRFDRIIPLADTSSGAARWRGPLVIGFDRTDSTYYELTAPVEGKTPIGVAILDDRPGVRLLTRYAHQLGKDDFSGSSDHSPELDWRELFITVMTPTNERATWTETASSAYPGPIEKTLTIDVPDAEIWFLAGGTVTGVNAAATGLEIVGSGGSIVRNDLDILKRVAQAAASWYSQPRTKLRVPYTHCDLVLDSSGDSRLGQVVKETYTGTGVTPTGTIISRITYRLGTTQTSEFETEWRDLGVASLLRGVRGDQGSSPTRGASHGYRPRAAASAPEVIVPPAAALASAGSLVLADSSGNIYGNGPESAPTETGVTIQNAVKSNGDAESAAHTGAGGWVWVRKHGSTWYRTAPNHDFLTYDASTRDLVFLYNLIRGPDDTLINSAAITVPVSTNASIVFGGAFGATSGSLALSTAGLDWYYDVGNIQTASDGSLVSLTSSLYRPTLTALGPTEDVVIGGTTLHFVAGIYTGNS